MLTPIKYKLFFYFLNPPFTDPNNLYPWQTEPPGSKDKLDFRHHNYKEMRKVRRWFLDGASASWTILLLCLFPS